MNSSTPIHNIQYKVLGTNWLCMALVALFTSTGLGQILVQDLQRTEVNEPNLFVVPYAFSETLKELHENMQWDVGVGLRALSEGGIGRLDVVMGEDSWSFWAMFDQPF